MTERKDVTVVVNTLDVDKNDPETRAVAEKIEGFLSSLTCNVFVIHTPSGVQSTIKTKHANIRKFADVAVAKYRSQFDANAPDEHFTVIVVHPGGENIQCYRYQTSA